MNRTIESDQRDLLRAIALTWLSTRRRAKKALADMDYDLTQEQIVCLEELKRKDGLELGVLADRIDRERTTVTRMIDGLEKRNLVVRVADRDDKRNRLVYLTKLGRKRIEDLDPVVQEFHARMMNGVTQPQIQAALRVLKTIIANAESE